MRGSIYYQTSLLAKAIFDPGLKKENRKNPDHPHWSPVASFQTMETYRRVWNNFGLFMKDELGVNDFQKTEPAHIEGYMLSKIDIAPSKQYMEKISSALGKLEFALSMFTYQLLGIETDYDFAIRHEVLSRIKKKELLYDGYHDRRYNNPQAVIDHLKSPNHMIAAQIQLESGARFEGIGLIKAQQIRNTQTDNITNRHVTTIITKEKGGNTGKILVNSELVEHLQYEMLKSGGTFKIVYNDYLKDIRQACKKLHIVSEGSHGFRWNFAQNRLLQYQNNGYSYNEALQNVSYEMKHRRASISEHYQGIQPAH